MNRIKQLRMEKNIKQDVLAKLLGLEVAGISKLETGRVPLKDEYIIKLADYFEVSTDYLLCKSDIRKTDAEIKQEFEFAYHKEAEGLTDEEIADAIRFYKQIKYGKKDENN
jgi:transcriptional regulator with XRE-family HTH domain|nr:MAG TPA: helix-turn-helix domain protein [Caudoviricetes sp.]